MEVHQIVNTRSSTAASALVMPFPQITRTVDLWVARYPCFFQGRSSYDRWKRVVDGVVSGVLLLLSAPLVLALACLVKLTSRGPAFYLQPRVGRHGRVFTMFKLRTMVHNCESITGPCWSMPGDPRLTPLGRWLRATHLDELPQLLNVVRGDMSLVGPRPERPEFVRTLNRLIPGYRYRLLARPGMTGLAQVQLPSDTNLGSVRRKLSFDLYYLSMRGWGLDWRILTCTLGRLAGVPFRWAGKLFLIPDYRAVARALETFDASPATDVGDSLRAA